MKKFILAIIICVGLLSSCGIEYPILSKNTNSNIITKKNKSREYPNMCYYHVNGSVSPFVGLCISWEVGDTLKIIE